MWTYIHTDELYHHGILGMKWGKRRFQNKDGSLTPEGEKRYRKVTKKYELAGTYRGRADYEKSKGDEAAEPYMRDARLLDRQAEAWESRGDILLAESAKRQSQGLKDKASEARREYDDMAERYMRAAEHSEQKASAYATKKRVDLGKEAVNAIMENARKKTLAREIDDERALKEFHEFEQEFERFKKEGSSSDD